MYADIFRHAESSGFEQQSRCEPDAFAYRGDRERELRRRLSPGALAPTEAVVSLVVCDPKALAMRGL